MTSFPVIVGFEFPDARDELDALDRVVTALHDAAARAAEDAPFPRFRVLTVMEHRDDTGGVEPESTVSVASEKPDVHRRTAPITTESVPLVIENIRTIDARSGRLPTRLYDAACTGAQCEETYRKHGKLCPHDAARLGLT